MNAPLIRSSLSRLQQPMLIGTLTLLSAIPVDAQQTVETFPKALKAISADRMLADIRALSDPSFHGRQAGTEADIRSAAWVGDRFQSSGLTLIGIPDKHLSGTTSESPSPGLMSSIVQAPTIEPGPVLRIGSADALQTKGLGNDYLPVLDSPSADIQAPIVFVGYGTPADYMDVDVANRVVLFLRGKPEHLSKPVTHADKVRLARDKGAVAYLAATGPVLNPYEMRRGVTGAPSAFYSQMPVAETIPGVWISTQLAENVLAGNGGAQVSRLREIQEQLNKDPSARSVRTERYALLRWKTNIREGLFANVIAFLPGTGPESIIIGAHRDHFGRTAGLLFPGADDNASGTAIILEVARVLEGSGWRPNRTVLFVSFSGEEKDLLGSRLYIMRPAVPLDSTKAMINIDHAGIGNGRLTVGVTGLEKDFARHAGNLAGLEGTLDLFGFFPGGDHVPFKEAGIPTVTVVSGGVHPHFHQPTDTADTIDPGVLKTAAQYVLALVWQLANAP